MIQMIKRHAHGPLARSVAMVLLVTSAVSCMKWQTQAFPAAAIVNDEHPSKIRVTLHNGIRAEIASPGIVGDSLVGIQAVRGDGRRLSVALDDIRRVETRVVDGGRTMMALVGVGLTAAVIAAAAAAGNDPPPRRSSSSGSELYSCPLVYSWDGQDWRLDSGTFGGAITRAAARTDVDNLVYATASERQVRLKLANELNETEYVNALSVLIVDHDPNLSVAPDGDGTVHTLGRLQQPISAVDDHGRDVLDRVATPDDVNWESKLLLRDPGNPAHIRDGLELTFVRRHDRSQARLVIDGRNTPWAVSMLGQLVEAHGSATAAWYDSLNTQPRFLQQFGSMAARIGFLGVSVLTSQGWDHQGYLWEAGPEIVKRQVFRIDLSAVPGDTVRIRLESAPSFWMIDHVALDESAERAVEVREVRASRAVDHTGRDVAELLAKVDDKEFVMETGDHVFLDFNVPPLQAGKARSFLVRSAGWYRIHTTETEPPDLITLSRLANERDAASRIAVERMNATLRALGGGGGGQQ